MDIEIEKEFKTHLKRVCKNSLLRRLALEFFYDLDEKLKDLTFTIDSFEPIEFNGKYLEQDVANELFAKKDKASATEVFLYLFKSNIEHFKLFEQDNSVDDMMSGYFSPTEKKLCIRKINLSKYYDPKQFAFDRVFKPIDMDEFEWKKVKGNRDTRLLRQLSQLKKKTKETAIRLILAEYKHIVYHELCHVFNLKTFDHSRFIKNDFSNIIYKKVENFYFQHYCTNGSLVDEAKQIDGYNRYQKLLKDLEKKGSDTISETLNEELTLILDNSFRISHADNTLSQGMMTKASLSGICAYNINYDIISMIHLALPDETILDFCFNTSKVIKKLEHLYISPEKLDSCKQRLTYLILENDELVNGGKENAQDLLKLVNQSNIFSILCILLACSDHLIVKNNVNSVQTIADYKTIAQEILIEGIKNNLINQMNDKSVTKDEQFFIYLNDCLKTIDEFLIYPDEKSIFDQKDDSNIAKILSIENCHKRYPNLSHLTSFCELVKLAKGIVKSYSEKIKNLTEIMTFLNEQISPAQTCPRLNNSAKESLINNIAQRKKENISGTITNSTQTKNERSRLENVTSSININ